MARVVLRKLCVDGETYLWHRMHHDLGQGVERTCAELLTIYLHSFKKSPVRLQFRQSDNQHRQGQEGWWQVGYPQSGVLWLAGTAMYHDKQLNLNRPKVVATLIQLLRATTWHPDTSRSPLLIKNGLQLLDTHLAMLLDTIDAAD